jgi:hypothetical protein
MPGGNKIEIWNGSWNIYNGSYAFASIFAYDDLGATMEQRLNIDEPLPANVSIFLGGHLDIEFRMRSGDWFAIALANNVWIPSNRSQFMYVLKNVLSNQQ